MPGFAVEQANAILAENFAPWVLASGVAAEAVGADAATLRIPFSEQLCRIGGILCGQALLTGADTAMVIALAAASGGFKPCTTVDLTINYLRPLGSGTIKATARVLREGGRVVVTSADVFDPVGNLASTALSTYLRFIPGLSSRP